MNPSAQLSRTTSRLGNLCVFCVLGGSLVLLVSLGANESFAQTWPSKPLRVVVPFTAASATDTIARIVAERLGSQLGQTLVVENRPGAGGTIGVGTVARAEADGYTLLVHSSSFTVTPTTYPNTPYDTLRDFSGVTPLGNLPNVLVIAPSRNIRSVKELVAAAKAKPGALTYASAGTGSPPHLSGGLLKTMAGIDLLHVPYKGAPQAITDLMAGRVDTQFANATVALPQIKAGTVRPLAVTSARRFAALPDVPTLAEAGLPNFEADQWLGILVPAGTPAKVLQRLRAETDKALAKEEVRAALAQSGMTVARAATLPEFAAYIKQDLDKWAQVVKAANIKQD